MARRLPPLNALRAFEAAARNLSISRAAAELNVTPAAVSHQVKALEAELGVPLFRRKGRDVLLTEAGQSLLPGLRDGFDQLRGAVDKVLQREESGELRVSVMPSFAGKWLIPRLFDFSARHSDISVLISSSTRLVDLAEEGFHAAIRIGRGNYPGLEVVSLFGEVVFPVCAPALLQGPRPLREPADLARYNLLHDDFYVDWETWLTAAGVTGVDVARGPRFDDSLLTIIAAVNGEGVALARGSLVADDLAASRLVKPFALSLPSDMSYYLVYLPGSGERPKIKAFRDWLLEHAAVETLRQKGLGDDAA